MTSRIAFDSWQMTFPAIGFVIFVIVFGFVVMRVWRMTKGSVQHLEQLPLEQESPRSASHVRSDSK
jgi:hypothetical protein